MAGSASHIFLVLLAIAMYNIYESASDAAIQSSYPSGSLACKTYNMTKMDCGNRNLPDIPVLDQNLTTSLDLSHNQLMNIITDAPFEKLQVLKMLNLSYNEISQVSSSSFKGLALLETLDLQENKLKDLPKDIFSDFHNLLYLNLNANDFTAIPGQALASLDSLQDLSLLLNGEINEMDLEGFENMTNLISLHIYISSIKANLSSDTFFPLKKLPLRVFSFGSVFADMGLSISKDAFSPLTGNITRVLITFTAFLAIPSLQCPCQHLILTADSSSLQFVNNRSLQILQKWNASLESLTLNPLTLERIEDYAFIWISNLHFLDLASNIINYLAKYAFYGLNALQQLILFDNALTYLPSDALEVFRKSGSLQYLDLSSNRITKRIDRCAFSAVSTSLSYLSLEISYKLESVSTDWIGVLQNLKHLTLACSVYCNIRIISDWSQPSLQTVQFINIETVEFETPLCILFPSLQVNWWSSYSDFVDFPLLDAIQGCSDLKELDLSGTLQNTNLVDFRHVNITISELKTLTLIRNKLTSLKLFFFISAPKLTHLNLARNKLKTIDSEIVNNYPRLMNLNIKDNELTSLSGLEHLIFLQNLIAATNKITVVPTWLLSKASKLGTLDLSNNPFQCTCRIEPFRSWIATEKKTWLQPGQYVCTTLDNFKGMSITAIELDCQSRRTFYLSITIPSVLFFCVLLIILFRYRWHIKYKLFLLYRNYHPFPQNEDFELLQLQYHAFVAYNENAAEDDAWVMNELQPNMEEGPEPLRLCIKSRDFIPGHFLLDSIDESIHQSRKTILLLSPNFVASEWCYHEMRMVQMRLLDDNLDVIVLVLLDEIPENKMTLSLRQLLCKKEYLKWPKNKVGQRLFWQQLRQEIKGPVHVDCCFQL